MRKSDIARLAGVSPATVSNFYNGKQKLSEKTKKRIIEVANELNYPLPQKKHSADRPAMTVLAVEDILNPHYTQILQGMRNIAMQYNMMVYMCPLWPNIDAFCNMLVEHGATTVYFAVPMSRVKQENLQMLADNNIKALFEGQLFAIDFDDLLNKAIKYLADLGHRKIAYLSGLSINDPRNVRLFSFKKALQSYHLTYNPDLIIDGIYPYATDAKSGYWSMRSFLSKNPDFTALVAINDLMAIGAMNALAEGGLNTPADISVIGCDNISLTEHLNPSLTTMSFSTDDIAKIIMNSALQGPEEDITQSSIAIQTDLVIRKSTGKPPVK